MMEIDRRAFLATLPMGAASLGTMSSEDKAEALENYMMGRMDAPEAPPEGDGGEADACAREYRKLVGDERRHAYGYRLYARREVIDNNSAGTIARLPERKSAGHAGARH